MKYKEALDIIFNCLEVNRKGELTKELMHMLHNAMMKFFIGKKKGYTDGEDIEDVIDGVMGEMSIWVLAQKGVLKKEEVERVLTNQFQKIKDRADRERRKLEVYKLTPLMRLRTELSPENIFEREQMVEKKREEANVKAVQDFERIRAEMAHLTEPEWLFMKRLPFTDPLWEFLGLVGMERFSIFFHDYEGFTFKMATAEKIERTKSLKPPTDKEFVDQVNKWIHQQTSHNLFKK